jgi:hypothetical protein
MVRKLLLAAMADAIPTALLATVGSGAASSARPLPTTAVTFVGTSVATFRERSRSARRRQR